MTKRKRNPAYRRRRRNPSARSNPDGITGIVMNGFWIGVGMWAGGLINSLIPQFGGGGMLIDVARGVGSAYIVGMAASRFIPQNASLMAAGAFAPVAWGVVSNLTSGLQGGLSSLASSLTSAPVQQMPVAAAVPSLPTGNVMQFPR